MTSPTDPTLALIADATQARAVPSRAPTYGRPTSAANLPPASNSTDVQRPLSVVDTEWFVSIPFAQIFGDPADPGGALDVISMTQVAGATAPPPVTPRKHAQIGTVENP